jgi:hypothetical protein
MVNWFDPDPKTLVTAANAGPVIIPARPIAKTEKNI